MTTSTQTPPAIEASCDLRFGQVGLACVRVHKADAAALHEALEHRVRSAPHLFSRAAVVLDFSHLPSLPDTDMAGDLLEAIRNAGMLPAGLAYGDQETEALARRINLPLISGFRAVYESGTPHPTTINTPASVQGTLHHDDTVRSGQRIYAHDRALVVTGQVANGAEVIADGDIHVYGKLRGRALAGAQGNHSARIFVSDFRAELIAIAGHYRVFEQIPDELERQFVRCWLENDTLWVTRL